jgi:D-alanyl-D-alanine carboxypeptidase/D-alanyl-D-alanine-endopeptidase (penicillin-binding protein 4)
MEDRLRKSKAKGKCFAKTGYVGGVRTLSGYLQHGNEWIAFSIMAMNFTQPRISIEEVQDHVIDYLSNWER